MNLMASRPPHVRSRESNFSVMSDVVIALLPLYVMAYFFYGSQVVTLGGVSVAVCLVLDYGITFLSSRRVSLPDLSPVITGMMIPLMLPSTVPLMTVIVADICHCCGQAAIWRIGAEHLQPGSGWSGICHSYLAGCGVSVHCAD